MAEPYFNEHVLKSILDGFSATNAKVTAKSKVIDAFSQLQGQIDAIGTGGVPASRKLSINGTQYDLSEDRYWTIPPATPVGADFSLQYNNAGAFGGTFTPFDATGIVSVNLTNRQLFYPDGITVALDYGTGQQLNLGNGGSVDGGVALDFINGTRESSIYFGNYATYGFGLDVTNSATSTHSSLNIFPTTAGVSAGYVDAANSGSIALNSIGVSLNYTGTAGNSQFNVGAGGYTSSYTPFAGAVSGINYSSSGIIISTSGTLGIGTSVGTAIYTIPATDGTVGQVLQTNGAGSVTWQTIASGVGSVSGTANRITSTGGATPVIDISASYVGQSSITTLGTVGTGVWQGTAIADTYISSAGTWNAMLPLGGGTLTGEVISTFAGTASHSAIRVTGAPFAGTGTTSFPLLYINRSTATASTVLNTAGTMFGVNGHGTADLANLMTDGVSQFSVDYAGNTVTNGIAFITGGWRSLGWVLGGTSLTNAANSAFTFGNTSNQIFTFEAGSVLFRNVNQAANLGFLNMYSFGLGSAFSGATAGTTPFSVLHLQQNNSRAVDISGNNNPPFTTVGAGLYIQAATYTDGYTLANGTNATFMCNRIDSPTVAATNANVTFTDVPALYIGEPIAGANAVLPNKWSLILSSGIRIDSTTQGILFPRMTTTQKNALTAIEGLEVYDLTLHQKSYYNGTTWINY